MLVSGMPLGKIPGSVKLALHNKNKDANQNGITRTERATDTFGATKTANRREGTEIRDTEIIQIPRSGPQKHDPPQTGWFRPGQTSHSCLGCCAAEEGERLLSDPSCNLSIITNQKPLEIFLQLRLR
jgi:hypothetical protein